MQNSSALTLCTSKRVQPARVSRCNEGGRPKLNILLLSSYLFEDYLSNHLCATAQYQHEVSAVTNYCKICNSAALPFV